ncbi:metallophosphoesterase [Listeria costaricensis]|uniref:metallophosphoesterase n=1 Tax=Listeria costaricensis TaxID=2026604 RepID=UPI000C072041|nr:metallophosphoesterase [Listeria costaricensis]
MKKQLYGSLVGTGLAFAGYAYYSTKKLTLTHYPVYSPKIPPAFDGKTFIQLSDLHSQRFGRSNHKLIKMVKAERPDAIFLTGDLLDGDEWIDVALALVRKLSQYAPLFYISGNHEQRSSFFEEFLSGLKQAGVYILHNETRYLKEGEDRIAICGVDDPKFHLEVPDEDEDEELYIAFDKYQAEEEILRQEIEQATARIPDELFTILLSHRPEFWPFYQMQPVDLILSGHAHGGQIRLPFTDGLFAPGQGLFPKTTSGLREANGRQLIVSRGLGNTTMLIPRVFNNPEIVKITLNHN